MEKTKKGKKMTEKALDNKCPNCGAKIEFKADLNKWKCDFCDSEFTLEEFKKYMGNASTDENNAKTESKEELAEKENADKKGDEGITYVAYHCPDCGAEIIADEQTTATFCIYCGNTAILRSKLTGKFTPDMIIPFKTDKIKAIEAFMSLSKGRLFVPKDFSKKENIEKIRGVYIPFWMYDIEASGELDFDAQKIRSWVMGDTRYTETNFFKCFRAGGMNFIKIPVDGSTRFDDDIMNSIEPFDYKDLIPYNHAYLSGYYAERYDIEGDKLFNEAAQRALQSAYQTMLNNNSNFFTGQVVTRNTLQATQLKRLYVLLPVYMVNVKYKDKMYLFAMNGQTGEFIGNIPLDKKKIALYSILAFTISCVIITFILYLIYLMGR